MTPVGDREWLHVCWLAEQTLTDDEWTAYSKEICEYLTDFGSPHDNPNLDYFAMKMVVSLPAEKRLLALCRVKFPEMFNPPTGDPA